MDPVESRVVEIFNSYLQARKKKFMKNSDNNVIKPKHNQKIFFNVNKIERDEKNISEFDKNSTILESKKSEPTVQINSPTCIDDENLPSYDIVCKLEEIYKRNNYFINNFCNFEFSTQNIFSEIQTHIAHFK